MGKVVIIWGNWEGLTDSAVFLYFVQLLELTSRVGAGVTLHL